ncbi:MAG: hypothetical protein WC876_01920 [Candidatus Thermoplasmatota archaeon]|jgi:hypothetical protein
MSDEARAKAKAFLLDMGKLCGALAAIGVVVSVPGLWMRGELKSWVIAEASAQSARVAKEDKDAQAAVNRQVAAAIDDVRSDIYEGKKDSRALSEQIRVATGVSSDRFSRPLPPPPSPLMLDGGP